MAVSHCVKMCGVAPGDCPMSEAPELAIAGPGSLIQRFAVPL